MVSFYDIPYSSTWKGLTIYVCLVLYGELIIPLLGHVLCSHISNFLLRYISQRARGSSPTITLTHVNKITTTTVTKICLTSQATYTKYVMRDSYREALRSFVITGK